MGGKFIKEEILIIAKRGKEMPNNGWEVSIIELKNGKGKKYKVTRRMPKMSASETKVFKTKKEALKQLQEWLS